jgi:hypothetical protein
MASVCLSVPVHLPACLCVCLSVYLCLCLSNVYAEFQNKTGWGGLLLYLKKKHDGLEFLFEAVDLYRFLPGRVKCNLYPKAYQNDDT